MSGEVRAGCLEGATNEQHNQLLILKSNELQDIVKFQSGGFGDIHRGWCTRLDREVAVKFIRGGGEFSKQLMREAKMMQKASHPYVLQLLGLFLRVEGDCREYGLVMEYLPFGSLYGLFQKMTPEPVPWALRFQILHQVALGMSYLHHELKPPLLHLDLKPKNVLLNGSLTAQLTDFGLSKMRDATSSSGAVPGGTWAYMPPEAFADIHSKPHEPFDVYSYGILIWSVLAAQEPYRGACAEQIMILIPQGQRPDEKILDKLGVVKMLPEARNLMVTCWSQVAAARPSFQDCVSKTQEMFAMYQHEIDDAVCTVLDRLKNPFAKEQEMKAGSTPAQEETGLSLPDSGSCSSSKWQTKSRQTAAKKSQEGAAFLRKHWATVVLQLVTIEPILDCLLQEGIINNGEYKFIMSAADVSEKVRKMLSMITRKGENSSIRFCQLLHEKEPVLVQTLQGLTD